MRKAIANNSMMAMMYMMNMCMIMRASKYSSPTFKAI